MRAMAHDTVPSAPALSVLRVVKHEGPALPSELRAIAEDFAKLREKLIACVLPEDPPRWRLKGLHAFTSGGDVFVELEMNKANRLLEHGRLVEDAAGRLAFGLLARAYGLERSRVALRGLWRA